MYSIKDLRWLGNVSPTRDLTFVKDTCKGFIEIYKSEKLYGEVTNIGMNEEISISDLVGLISKLIGKRVLINSDQQRVRPETSEVDRLWCNNAKIRQNTNWVPEYNLNDGLLETIEFIREHLHIYKPFNYNV